MITKCLVCNKEFYITPSAIKRNRGKYCSRKCYYISPKSNKKIKRICQKCGKEFKVWPYKIKENKGKYCSKTCFNKSPKKIAKAICQNCRKIFYSYIKSKYCSRKCYLKANNFLKGKGSPAWKGGIARRNDRIIIWNKNHPCATQDGYVLRSRLVMEQIINRYLKSSEIVHHINGITNDDRPENLRLFNNRSEHVRFHSTITPKTAIEPSLHNTNT